MNGGKRFGFEIRKPTLESVARALYLLGGVVVIWSVPRSVIVPVVVADVAVYVVAFVVVPALLRWPRGGSAGRERVGSVSDEDDWPLGNADAWPLGDERERELADFERALFWRLSLELGL